jgi:hypothetical protein
MLVERPNSVPSEERIGVAYVPRADFLTAETGMVYLLSHNVLHKSKRAKQDDRYTERDFV